MTRLRAALVCGLLPFASPAAGASSNEWHYHIPYFLSTSNPTQQSFVRVTWALNCLQDMPDAIISVRAVDDAGTVFRPIEIESVRYGRDARPDSSNECTRIIAFNSDDLEYGNPDKGIPVGVGQGVGDWQLFLESVSERWEQQREGVSYQPDARPSVFVQSFVRTSEGFLTGMQDVVPFSDRHDAYFVSTFNPARNASQQSRLRLVNPNDFRVSVDITMQHDQLVGRSYRMHRPTVVLRAYGSETVTALDLEGPNGGSPGKWRLYIKAFRGSDDRDTERLLVMNLMETVTGHLTNLSTAPILETVHAPPDPNNPTMPSEGPYFGESFDFQFVFAEDVPTEVRTSLKAAAERWERIIVGGFPDTTYWFGVSDCEVHQTDARSMNVDDIVVFVHMVDLGGPDGPTAQAGTCGWLSGSNGENWNISWGRPDSGYVKLNRDRKDAWEATSGTRKKTFDKIMIHQLAHVLGFHKFGLRGTEYLVTKHFVGTEVHHFAGPQALQAFWDQGGRSYSGDAVPMEEDANHWRANADDNAMEGEIMAPFVNHNSVISRITVQALADMGYEVNVTEADDWHKKVFKAHRTLVDLSGDVD